MKKLGIRGRDVRIGVIGLGGRGIGQMQTLLSMPDVKAAIVCDNWEDRAEKGADIAEKTQGFRPAATRDAADVLARDDIEGVAIFTSWQTHIPLAIEALRAGKYPALEVGGGTSLDQLWTMVRASEETRIPVMLLENCCYERREMTLLGMVRRGLFGELVHCGGGYCHDLRDEIGLGDIRHHYRQDNFLHRNGELYPTHDLGPIAHYLDIGRGNAILTVSSTASKARGLNAWWAEHRPEFAARHVCEGDVVDTVLRCANGETVHLVHDCTLPRPYSRAGLIQGTKGIWQEDGDRIFLEGLSPGRRKNEWTERWEPDGKYLKRFEHPLWKKYREFGLRGGHGGMDYLVLRAWIESLQNATPPPIDVYDTATWLAVTCLSEQSVALNGAPVPMPDFTNGRWLTRRNEDLGTYSL